MSRKILKENTVKLWTSELTCFWQTKYHSSLATISLMFWGYIGGTFGIQIVGNWPTAHGSDSDLLTPESGFISWLYGESGYPFPDPGLWIRHRKFSIFWGVKNYNIYFFYGLHRTWKVFVVKIRKFCKTNCVHIQNKQMRGSVLFCTVRLPGQQGSYSEAVSLPDLTKIIRPW